MKVIDGGITSPKGFKAAGIACGIKKHKRDLALIYSETEATCAIAYTQNKVKGAPLKVMIELDPKKLQAFIINSGNANTLTGDRGAKDARDMVSQTAASLGLERDLVGVVSTGIIGRFLPTDKIISGIKEITNELDSGRKKDVEAAQAILTTDTVIKEAACEVTLEDGTKVTIGGMAKGSGMISPAMKALHATTLSFITTDACLSPGFDGKWQDVMDSSFNQIDVDGDQSTNDMSVILANGCAGGMKADESEAFWEGVRYVAKLLAKQVALDGEGATKLISVVVRGARSTEDARKAAKAIVSSNLVKTAIFGSDPNYGRILCALGYSGAEMVPERVNLAMGANGTMIPIYEQGEPLIQTCGTGEEPLKELLKKKEIHIVVDIGLGNSLAEAWGCDLSYEYVKINAEYTT
ncbi:MAG: bifunctional ornithine acetyltransferase/N-acetylglutamate synthase [Methanomassiliicoccales archaeon]|nr:bifunctional ornithine acetyltransferase/N-acetylglutamate synthase [Methanomassiliicoccales archaeon]NYT14649.1 bifunctional ornithine acetyltransferase/N-acetylglutamate synthase [Methanomassiliicoccales archaeon]